MDDSQHSRQAALSQTSRPQASPPPGSRRGKGLIAAILLLAGGAMAWGVIVALLLTGGDSSPAETPSPTARAIAGQPTLGAVVVTPTERVTVTPTEIPATENPTAQVVPSVMPSVIAPDDAGNGTADAPPGADLPPTAPDASDVAGASDVSEGLDGPNEGTGPEQDAAGAVSVSDEISAAEVGALAATTCAPPAEWDAYTVQPDDTWFAFVLGAENALSVEDLMAANCLDRRWLQMGETIFLPPGAAENAPPSVAVAPSASGVSGATGPRTPNCPCTISIRPGWRREQIADAVDAAETLFTGADFLAVTGPGAGAPFDFVMERPAGHSMEGYLYPGTYVAENDTTAEAFRDMLLAQFGANVTPQIRADAAGQGVSFYEALIIASVTQRESYTPETQKLIASIFYNRLRDGNRLASTVPISYALGVPGNWWPRITGSNMNAESPYNTYTQPGLPPAPIDNPEINAILAAVYPAETNYYYHSRTCDGQAGFFETYEQHLANLNCD